MIKKITKSKKKLGERSKEFNVLKNPELVKEIEENLVDTIKDTDRLFLAACEIGYDERALAIKFADSTVVMFNPAFRKREGIFLDREKDVITGNEYFVPRFAKVEVVYQNDKAELKAYKLNEGASVVFCQAMDMLDGMLSCEYGLEIIPEFDAASKGEQGEVLDAYVKSLGELGKALDKELTDNSETGKEWETAKFIKAMSHGDIEFEAPAMSNREKKKLNNTIKKIKQQANKLKFWNKLKKGDNNDQSKSN